MQFVRLAAAVAGQSASASQGMWRTCTSPPVPLALRESLPEPVRVVCDCIETRLRS